MKLRSVLLAILAIGFGACTSQEEHVRLAARCADDGWRAWERYKASVRQDYSVPASQDILWFRQPPQFHFNLRLNSCLMLVSYVDGGFDSNEAVIDVYSNRRLETAIRFSSGNDPDGQYQAFIQNSKKLMGE